MKTVCVPVRLIAPLVVACLLSTAGSGSLADAASRDLSLQEALALTLQNNPALAVYPHRLRAADADSLQASLRPQPALSLDVENIAGSNELHGLDGAEVTLALSQLIELGAKRERRIRFAEAAFQREQLAYEIARLDVLGSTLEHYVALAEAQSLTRLEERALALARRAEAVAKRRVTAGASPQADLLRLRIATQRAELALREALLAQQLAARRLAAQWGETGHTPLAATTALTPLPALPSREQVQTQIQNAAPLLRQLLVQRRQQEAALQLAESAGRADLTVSLGLRHDRLSDTSSLLFGLSMPLHIDDPARAARAGAQARLAENTAQYAAAEQQLLTGVDVLYRKLQLLRDSYHALHQDTLPLTQRLYTEIEQGYEAGRYTALDLITARREQLDLERELIALASQFHLQRASLERLTGHSLSGAASHHQTPENHP